MSEIENKKLMPTFILQKDLPDAKAGDEFTWVEGSGAYHHNGKTGQLDSWWKGPPIENNPEWFRLKGDSFSITLSPLEQIEFEKHKSKKIQIEFGGGSGIKISCATQYGLWVDITDYSKW